MKGKRRSQFSGKLGEELNALFDLVYANELVENPWCEISKNVNGTVVKPKKYASSSEVTGDAKTVKIKQYSVYHNGVTVNDDGSNIHNPTNELFLEGENGEIIALPCLGSDFLMTYNAWYLDHSEALAQGQTPSPDAIWDNFNAQSIYPTLSAGSNPTLHCNLYPYPADTNYVQSSEYYPLYATQEWDFNGKWNYPTYRSLETLAVVPVQDYYVPLGGIQNVAGFAHATYDKNTVLQGTFGNSSHNNNYGSERLIKCDYLDLNTARKIGLYKVTHNTNIYTLIWNK